MSDQARQIAEQILLGNGSPIGLLGSSTAYKQVWARDSMICGLGLMVMGNPEGREIMRRSLRTLQAYQSRLGNIPHNVGFTGIPDPALIAHGGALIVGDDTPKVVVDTAHSGCIDNSLWFIIGNYYVHQTDHDTERLKAAWPALQRAYTWLEYQDSNECGLLEVHEAMDWADLFANRYNSLWPNVLWYAVQKCMGSICQVLGHNPDPYLERADDIKFKINTLLWVGAEVQKDLHWVENHRKEWLYPIRAIQTLYQERPYFLPYMGFREWCDRFDTFGNLCAVLFGLATEQQTHKIFDFIKSFGVDEPHPIKALHPPVMPGDRDWREYYRLRNLNLPDQYHNGGAWPFLGGFYVAALVKAGRLEEAKHQLSRLTEMNRMAREPGQEWDFNEWFHGRSGKPSGFRGQSWSTAMYIYAHESVKRGECPVFNSGGGW